MELAAAALGSLLPKLATLLSEEYMLQKGVRGEIRFLKAEMESMQAALERVSRLPAHQIDELNKIWVRDLKELAYDIEDSVDAFMVRVDSPVHGKPHSFRKFFDRTINLLTKAKNRHHIADDIQDIKRRIDEVANRRERYKFDDAIVAQADNTVMDPRLPALYEDVKKLVGIDGPAEKLTALLMHGEDLQNQQLKVVSIVGVGGLGKTTLANLVYQSLRGQFQSNAFVSISLKPDIKNIFSSMLRQVSETEYPNAQTWNVTELIDKIRQTLEKKRYFIVIDDLWEENAWEIIKCALVDNNFGSRIIVTTRNIDVANFASVGGEVYELDPLSEWNSRRLLCKRVFNEEDGIYSELEEVTKKILKKCGGIPLAIITIASMLASRPNTTKYEWYDVYNSMGSGLEIYKTLDNLRNILHLSYNDLPLYLKPCLLYLSMFPEDFKIGKGELIRLWVAEGFVVEEQVSNSYDIGERYFNELVNRSMIMPVDVDEYGAPTACRVHDVILDLIISISAQENFSTIPEGLHLKSTVCKIRRLSIQCEQKILRPTDDMAHVRSIIVFGVAVQGMPPLPRFSFLRVLSLIDGVASKVIQPKDLGSELDPENLEGIDSLKFLKPFGLEGAFLLELPVYIVNQIVLQPKDLGSLHHLRYLKLGGELEPELLEGIGNLKLLKTLDLEGVHIEELPACIVQLRQLERLLVHRGSKFPDGIGNLTSLQELSMLNVDNSPNTLVELGKLRELRVLTLEGFEKNESYMETFLLSLSNLGNLRTLNFCDFCGPCSINSVSDQWRGPARLQVFNGSAIVFCELPRWFSTLSELSCLSIRVNLLRQVDIQLLGALPVLRFLNLRVGSGGTTEERLVIGSDQPFRSLAEFKFTHRSRCWLLFGQGVMPRLQRLELYFEAVKNVGGGFDAGLENLTSLKHVTFRVCCEGARIRDLEEVETKIRGAVDGHPNHPALVLSSW